VLGRKAERLRVLIGGVPGDRGRRSAGPERRRNLRVPEVERELNGGVIRFDDPAVEGFCLFRVKERAPAEISP
jgi:hypothetical protein